jgi:hypothetical protein
MANDRLIFLCISLRGSERNATLAGKKLDGISNIEPAFNYLKKWLNTKQAEECFEIDGLLNRQKATAVMGAQFLKIFNQSKIIKLDKKCIQIDVDGVSGRFEALACSIHYSNFSCLEAVEGDDIVFIILLKKCENKELITINKRPTLQAEASLLLSKLGVLPVNFEGQFTNRYRSGFYIISDSKLKKENDLYTDDWIMNGLTESTAANMFSVGYMFYCYLVCLRVERLLLDISANGDWDDEYRKLLLARKKLVAVRKSALIKNRAEPESELLMHFKSVIPIFRLEEQLEYLGRQTDETSKVMEEQNNYSSAKRIQSIEIIIFISTILSLAVAINAIQMAPFYDQNTPNALNREIFWIVTGAVIGAGMFLWGMINQWRKTKLMIRWLKRKFSIKRKG